jgi:hypothetical protein
VKRAKGTGTGACFKCCGCLQRRSLTGFRTVSDVAWTGTLEAQEMPGLSRAIWCILLIRATCVYACRPVRRPDRENP